MTNNNNDSWNNRRGDGSRNESTDSWRDMNKDDQPRYNFGSDRRSGRNSSSNNTHSRSSYNRSYYDNESSRQTSIYSQGSDWRTREFKKSSPIKDFKKKFYNLTVKEKKKPTAGDVESFLKENEITLKNSNAVPIFDFDDLKIENEVFNYFHTNNFTKPTPIQSIGWPIALEGRDMVGIAQTGSGKSLSFIIPALINIFENKKDGKNVVALVLAPTRELIVQIEKIVNSLSRAYRIKTAVLYGGVSSFKQRNDLKEGASFICATPGRLLDLASQDIVPLHKVSYLVLDEADRMLDMGFEPQLKQIVNLLPEERQTLMWSATWPRSVQDLAATYMKTYSQVQIGGNELVSNKKIEQTIKIIRENEKFDCFFEFLRNHGNEKIIVFGNTKNICNDIEREVSRNDSLGVRCVALHGGKPQYTRDKIINDFKHGNANVLVATDVAARGLDVKNVSVVLNFDMPNNCEQYVHRIGRTGRGGSKGKSLTFFTTRDSSTAHELIQILRKSNQKIPEELQEISRNSQHSNNKYSGSGRFSSFKRPRKNFRW